MSEPGLTNEDVCSQSRGYCTAVKQFALEFYKSVLHSRNKTLLRKTPHKKYAALGLKLYCRFS